MSRTLSIPPSVSQTREAPLTHHRKVTRMRTVDRTGRFVSAHVLSPGPPHFLALPARRVTFVCFHLDRTVRKRSMTPSISPAIQPPSFSPPLLFMSLSGLLRTAVF